MGMWDVEQINDNVEQEMTQSDVGRYRDQVWTMSMVLQVETGKPLLGSEKVFP